MKSRVVLFIVTFIVWAMLNWLPDWQHILIGLVVSAFVSLMIGDLFISRPGTLRHVHRYQYFFIYYLPVFLWECIKANIDVAYRVIHPNLPIKPAIVKVKTSLKSDVALTFLANSITLTPGTMTVDIDKDNGIIYVHWINATTVDTRKATKELVDKFERILKKIFD